MEQLDQLVGIRDSAQKRLEAARAALERSPDAKLVASLTLLIDDLKASFANESAAVAPPPPPLTAAKPAPPKPAPAKAAAPQTSEKSSTKSASEEMSLEDSLEAELLKVDS